MNRLEDTIGRIIEQSKKQNWDSEIPIVSAKLRLAVSSLADQLPEFWNKPTDKIVAVLKKNKGVRKILANCSEETIAFAIRDRRM